jgi:hypothetical protein
LVAAKNYNPPVIASPTLYLNLTMSTKGPNAEAGGISGIGIGKFYTTSAGSSLELSKLTSNLAQWNK